MKIIFSRKGYDSKAGGVASPIFCDDTFCSFPIPSERPKLRLKDIRFQRTNLGFLVKQLAKNSRLGNEGVHLDPDLDYNARPRKPGWLPAFGQVGAAQTHLETQKVGKGDLFLFFGWFRRVLTSPGEVRYDRTSPPIHCLFGWLQVGKVYQPGTKGDGTPHWAVDHPHVQYARTNHYKLQKNNTLYVAFPRLRVPGIRRSIAGGGIFPHFTEHLRLTAPGSTRSVWKLPNCLYPKRGVPALSYHEDRGRWRKTAQGVLLRTVGRGQEFVLDCRDYPGVLGWLSEVFKAAPTVYDP